MIKLACIALLFTLSISADAWAQSPEPKPSKTKPSQAKTSETKSQLSFGVYIGGAWPTRSERAALNNFGLSAGLIKTPGFIYGLDFTTSGVGLRSSDFWEVNINALTYCGAVHWFPQRTVYVVGLLGWKHSRYSDHLGESTRVLVSYDDLAVGLGVGGRFYDLWVLEARHYPGLRSHNVGGADHGNSLTQLRLGILYGDIDE